VEVTQSKRHARSDAAKVELDGHNRISRVNLTGHANASDPNPLRNVEFSANRVQGDFTAVSGHLHHLTAEGDVVGESRGKGGISHLTSERCDIELGGEHPQPRHGVASGNVHINLESQPVLTLPVRAAGGNGPEKKSLTAGEVQFDFRPDTHGLKDTQTVGPGTLVFTPADPKTGGKVITAGQFLMDFDARSRIESLRGLAPTKVLFTPAASAPAGSTTGESRADRLNAVFDPGTQTLREVRQTGNFQYRDGDRQASADDAHYDAETQLLLLLGHPQVWDPNSRVRSQQMTIDMRTNTSTGQGNVQATHLQTAASGAPPASSPPLPTNVLADNMVSRRESQTIHYEGHVRAWQGTSVVESTALDVYRTQKRVSTGAQVITSFLQPPGTASGPTPAVHAGGQVPVAGGEGRPVTVHADSLEYFDQGRRARYHGNVRLVTESTTVQSDRLDVYFSQGATVQGSEVDHAEADGHVRVTQPGRLGTGDHGEYFAGPGKIVLTGGPPMVVDEEKGSTTGQRLTFFIHDDRLFVDGGDKSPSLSKHRVAP
jgi:lipopolysaccharide transport protein LptA